MLGFMISVNVPSGRSATVGYVLNRRVGPPAAHHGLGSPGTVTTSWMERQATWPCAGVAMMNAFVDSQDADKLEVSVDGQVGASLSGFHKGGRLAVPVSAGAHTIRLAYTKDASIDEGLDTAWVDDVQFVCNGNIFEAHNFSEAVGCEVSGWARGGYGGGWCANYGPANREWRRPTAMAFAGYQPNPTQAGIARDITWPAGDNNELVVGYFVDSEQDHDAFRILIDGTEEFHASGRIRQGVARIPVAPGQHHVLLAYAKDESVDEGYDEVRINSVEARANGSVFSYGGLAGSQLSAAPPSWVPESTNVSAGWMSVNPRAPRIYVRPGAAESNSPVVAIADRSANTSQKVKLRTSLSDQGVVQFKIQLPDDMGAWFMTQGRITLMVDSGFASQPLVDDCGMDSLAPGPHARRLELTQGTEQQLVVAQSVGTCGANGADIWRTAGSAENWPVMTTVSIPDSEHTAVILVIEVTPVRPAGLTALDPLSMALMVYAPVPNQGERLISALPWAPNHVVDDKDVSSWEELRFKTTEIEPAPIPGVPVDGFNQ
jgi:hypothetical protein